MTAVSLVSGEEELRGFLLFLSTQFLSARAELTLETLKSSLRLVGRYDMLRDFNGEVAASSLSPCTPLQLIFYDVKKETCENPTNCSNGSTTDGLPPFLALTKRLSDAIYGT